MMNDVTLLDVKQKVATLMRDEKDAIKQIELEKLLRMLNSVRTEDINEKDDIRWYERIDLNVVVGVAGNILSILLVLNFEKLNVISSRSTAFWKRST
jgi:hypothetical protein